MKWIWQSSSSADTEKSAIIEEYKAKLQALELSQAVIEFELDGTIITANENFLNATGYQLHEIQGKHHSLFMPNTQKQSQEYKAFWQKLKLGQFQSGEYHRIAKGGRDLWIQASYNPLFDESGKPYKVVKFASDITEQKTTQANFEGQINAIHKAQAVIEFNLDGTIITANENFLNTVGYNLNEIQGKHHLLFVPDEIKQSDDYQMFWQKLNQGQYQAGEYKRIAKGNKEVWIQASYNPIFDANGTPYKVVKFATDITERKLSTANYKGQMAAIHKAQAVIEFNLDGTILTANENFLNAVGYTLDEIQGQHHRLFVPEQIKNSSDYLAFWQALKHGQFQAGEYKRIAKSGDAIWIQASYNPILDANGNPYKVVKFATDITEQKMANANFEGQIDAIDKAQAVIEFNLDGTIITANENFLQTMGYQLSDIQGEHHSLFAPNGLAESNEYKQFWQKLNRGEFQAGEYKRIAKNGREVWIQASYNPIFNADGEPYKVVKFATEITEQKLANANFAGQIAAIHKAQAVIEFNLDGTIITANDNFLDAVGYTLSEIQGKHHRLFMPDGQKNSAEYEDFWRKLNKGEFQTNEYQRIAKGGREIWIQASYNPILDAEGRPYKVVKFATDVTPRKIAVNEVSRILKELAKGNLSQTILVEFDKEFSALKESVNSTITTLNNSVTHITQSASLVASSSNEIAQGNSDLSQRTEEQAASLEETASSMDQMITTVTQNAENAKRANELAIDARTKAQGGDNVVNAAIRSMSEINDASKKISDIIGVIDEIAFQTNLLALNAAVEAARAGEQGRGFAVVAGEVRNLAQRSASAAKEIKELIRDSVAKVEEGATHVNQSGDTLKDIINAVERVNTTIADIATASEEQSAGITQVNKAISQMDEMTQQNAALVEQAAAASESIVDQVSSMNEYLAFFNVSPTQHVQSKQATLHAISDSENKQITRTTSAPQTYAIAQGSDEQWEEF